MRWLLVVARNSSFTYKGQAVDVKQVGRALGVRYVLEGSVRKAAHRVRITAQLIATATAAHLWADRFDGTLENIFELQDRVSASVVGAIAPKLEQFEIERAKRKPTESLDAYDYYLRGMASVHRWTDAAISDALRLFYRAIELDPDFASAYGMAAWCYARRKANGWMSDVEQELAETERVARRAVELGKDDAVALCTAGYALARATGDLDDGAAFIDRALVLNPNLFTAWLSSGWVKSYIGEPDAALSCLSHAMRLSPLDPFLFGVQEGIAFAHLFTGRYDEASSWAEKAIRENPTWVPAWRTAAASHALAGRLERARRAMARMCQLDPELRVSKLKDTIPLRRAEDLAKFAEALRKAGLPD
jgi:tetratricopeptide (TPR) repeat protein